MKTKKLNKKGFTLVELVVVVAVIAVLSAILIPTIGCFVEEAKETNDMATVRLLNVALVEDEAENGTPATVTEALAAMDRKGYDIEKLNLRSTGEIYWDGANNRFMLLKGDEVLYGDNTTPESERYNWWKLLKNGDALSTTYSNYLKEGYEAPDGALTISTGLDVGNNTGITAITYKNTTNTEKNITVRTNSFDTVLYVNGALDIVRHYGNVKEVNVVKVAKDSYHEFGTVSGNINLAYGKVELESGSSISNLVVKELGEGEEKVMPASDSIKVVVAENAKANLVMSEAEGVSVPVEGAGASKVNKIEEVNGKAVIGSTVYTTFKKALEAANENDTITLLANATVIGSVNIDKNVTIDLNNYKLTFRSINIKESYNLTIKNGVMVSTCLDNEVGMTVKSNAGVRLANVEYLDAFFGIFPAGDASFVDIYNSTIKAVAGVATNASGVYSNNIKMTIDSSVIDASDNGSEIGVWLNVPGLYTINNSIIKGNVQALMVRAGTVVVKNSQLIMTANGSADPDERMSGSTAWGTGNAVPQRALIVGDWTNGAYPYTASCTLQNTEIKNMRTDWTGGLIVLAQNGERETILNYDSNCNIKDSDYQICNYAVGSLKKGQITVNGKVVQQREK